jgi:hypothetical protein
VNHGEIVSFLWGVADLIRDTFKRGEYGAKASLKDSGSTLHKKRRCETRLNSRRAVFFHENRTLNFRSSW